MPAPKFSQKGYIEFLFILGLLILFTIFSFQPKFSLQTNSTYKTPDCVNKVVAEKTISLPSLERSQDSKRNYNLTGPNKTYKLIRSSLPLSFTKDFTNHLIPFGKYTSEPFNLYIPKSGGAAEINFRSATKRDKIRFDEWGIIFLVHLNSDGSEASIIGKKNKPFHITDIYQDTSSPKGPLPKEVFNCEDLTPQKNFELFSASPTIKKEPMVYFPEGQSVSQDKRQLQLEYFLLDDTTTAFIEGGWSPHCKPAIYLYPKNKTLVNVQVFPEGELTYTDPKYPKDTGWMAWAYPNGSVEVGNKIYPYLYYEAKIRDQLIQVPKEGFVVKKEGLQELFDQLLPKLGLSEKEASEFKDYWIKSLPNSPFYFVGILPQEQIDFLEPLNILPKPDSNIRVHLYFKLLDQPIKVKTPVIQTPKRAGFTMVEWGGMIKLNKDSSFTCLQ